MSKARTVLFDLDGTLYEDEAIYDRYAEELARCLPVEDREGYLDAWERAKRGQSVVRIGLGFDAARNLLFRHDGRHVTAYLNWDGEELPPLSSAAAHDEHRNPLEAPAFGPERFAIGDWWRLPDVLAARHGVPRDQRSQAFARVRAYMADNAYALALEPGMRETLHAIRAAGMRIDVMSNSPRESVLTVLRRLDLLPCFDEIIADAEKPAGVRRYLAHTAEPQTLISIGDNFVNEIEPVLEGGGWALYIDRHRTGFGADRERCASVPSIRAAVTWMESNLLGGERCPPNGARE